VISSCLPLRFADNQGVGREDRAMLRSNPSALPDVRAWAATLLSLLIFLAPHARTSNAINLLDTHSISPFTEIPWLPFGKIYGARPSDDQPRRSGVSSPLHRRPTPFPAPDDRLVFVCCPLPYSPSFGSTVAAAVNSSDAARYSGRSAAVAGMYFSTRSRVP
jgi:hypothetical protein